jgi:hypothetical protein
MTLIRLPEARVLVLAAAAVLGVVLFATVGAAALPDSPELSNVAQPNLKAAGYAPGQGSRRNCRRSCGRRAARDSKTRPES